MKIQLSSTRIIKDALTVWSEPGPEVDIVMDLTNLTFREGSIDAIYSFHVLDHIFPNETVKALSSWRKCLKQDSEIFVVVDDFEFISRGYVGGDIKIGTVNSDFSHPTNFDRFNLADLFQAVGFLDGDIRMWHSDVTDLFPKENYELVMAATKK